MATTFDDKKIIYTMDRVTKRYGTKVVLKDIRLSYYYGAKIGVIGLNGSGKSSLLRILAGLDTEILGRDLGGAGLHDRLPGAGAEDGGGQDGQGRS